MAKEENTASTKLADLIEKAEAAAARLNKAVQDAALASNAEVDARNALNAAQQAVDQAMNELRDRSPSGTHWK